LNLIREGKVFGLSESISDKNNLQGVFIKKCLIILTIRNSKIALNKELNGVV